MFLLKLGAAQLQISDGQKLKIISVVQLLDIQETTRLWDLLVTILANQDGLPIIGNLAIHL